MLRCPAKRRKNITLKAFGERIFCINNSSHTCCASAHGTDVGFAIAIAVRLHTKDVSSIGGQAGNDGTSVVNNHVAYRDGVGRSNHIDTVGSTAVGVVLPIESHTLASGQSIINTKILHGVAGDFSRGLTGDQLDVDTLSIYCTSRCRAGVGGVLAFVPVSASSCSIVALAGASAVGGATNTADNDKNGITSFMGELLRELEEVPTRG